MSAATLLVELLCEELPPKALARLGEAFAQGVFEGLKKRGLAGGGTAPRSFATPRRLAVAIDAVRSAAEPRALEVKLMPVTVGLDASGRPTPALLKKLEAAGLSGLAPEALARRVDGKAEMLFAATTTAAVPLADALQGALDEAIAGLPIPKVMSYQLADGVTTVQFVRPAHGLVALHGAQVVPVRALGLEAGRVTHGHRFQGAADIALERAEDYERRLGADGNVMAGFEARRAAILEGLQAAAKGHGASLGPEADYLALLDEVTALVEMPTVYAGAFEREYLAVPAECLVLTMRQNQKYFPLFDAAGKLTHRFLIVSNLRPADPALIIGGNERVVRPRLADARFFFDTDRKTPLAERVPQLAAIVYHGKLGTQLERVERLRRLAAEIQERLPRGRAGREWADRAAMLAKADLVTLMVGEFPELQGVMGRHYAAADGEEPSVVRAIEQHYWPRFAGDALPTGDASIAVALADRLDALAGLFAVGQVPTGDKDPFALRRAALGIVRILMDTPLALELDTLVRAAVRQIAAAEGRVEKVVSEVGNFVRERMENLLRERGYTALEVAAVAAAEAPESQPQRLDLVPARLAAVREFGKLPEAASLAAANKRISNILRQAQQKGEEPGGALDAAALGDPLERDLLVALREASARARAQFEQGDYTGYLRSFAVLKAPVDAFFDGVMVMADDPAVRRQRLGLLHELRQQMNRVADLSRLAA